MMEKAIDLITEANFQAAVIELAEACGWWVWKDYDPRRNQAGWPDLFLWRNGYILFAELKREKGKRTPLQDEMAQKLMLTEARSIPGADLIPLVRYYLWRPSDWDEIEEILR
jgi:hypothetical protein